jgi:creatinine amidohydrolase/Fe(II)-dependent formamide hydrolase-like protein
MKGFPSHCAPRATFRAAAARVVAVATLLAALPAAHAAAPAPAPLELEQLTTTELRAAVAAGRTTILVPIGGTEQNGPHMVLGKHNLRVRLLAERIAGALGNALVAPVIAYVPEGGVAPPTAHMRFPGTITVPDDVFMRLLESAARSFRLHGFRDVVFLGDHGGYQKDLHLVAERLNREWAAGPARAHVPDAYYRAVETDYPRLLRERGYRADEIGTHAGLADTSLALALAPELVRGDRLPQPGGAKDGVYGDPRRASADLGQLGVDAIVNQTTQAIRQATTR